MRDVCLFGDCRESMRKMIAEGVKVQTCVTSPPYWGLRDYGVAGQLGLESTPEEYVANMVEVFRLVRDLLADDGTLWLNLGDSYASDTKGDSRTRESKLAASGLNLHRDKSLAQSQHDITGKRYVQHGLKSKDLVGIPWRVAFALQADGWYLRSDIIWHKPNPMPESVTDRPTKAHEYLFLMSKRERYFYDADAIKEAEATRPQNWTTRAFGKKENTNRNDAGAGAPMSAESVGSAGRNRRTVWTVATEPYAEAHFATFPTALIEPCILAGTSQKGHCPACGRGWVRIVERSSVTPKDYNGKHLDTAEQSAGRRMLANTRARREAGEPHDNPFPPSATLGWQPSCACNLEPVPGIVFDPFLGSGTTAQVAQALGRHWLGCELNSGYFDLQKKRAAQMGLALA